MGRPTLTVFFVLGVVAPAQGQTLSESVSALFNFGACGQPLCLDVNAAVHGGHFVPSIVQGASNTLEFLNGAITIGLGQLPFPSANSGEVLAGFDAGLPNVESVTPGPILAERSQTMGKGTYLLGLTFSGLRMSKIRGVGMDELVFDFPHQNVQDQSFGDPIFEQDVVRVNADIQLDLMALSMSAAFGVADVIDIGVLVPVVWASLRGTSSAQVIGIDGPPTGVHRFQAGSFEADNVAVDNSAVGLGDIGVRIKANLHQTPSAGIGLVVDARLPTGDEENFLGTGESSVRALLVASWRLGSWSPHVNTGFALRSGTTQNNTFLAVAGFDWGASDNLTLVVDALADLQIGASNLVVPPPVTFAEPAGVELLPAFPDIPDHLLDISAGLKYQLSSRLRLISNVVIPLRDAGVRPTAMWTVGVERTAGGR